MEGDDTPVKRQRTSLVNFASFGNRNHGDAHVSPIPKRASSNSRAVSNEKLDLPQPPKRVSSHEIRSPIRASFMSPTRASLARFNPHLLPPTSSNGKPHLPAGSAIPRNLNDSRPQPNGEEIPIRRSVTPPIVEERSGTDGGNLAAGADPTAPEATGWAKREGLFDTPPKRRPQTLKFIVPRTAQSQKSPVSEVGAPLPEAREENHEGSPTAPPVQSRAEPQNGTSADRISNEAITETEDVVEHESGSLQNNRKHLFDGFSEVAKPSPLSIFKELGHDPSPDPPNGLLFSSPSIRPWGMKQPDPNSSPPASLHYSSPVSGTPSLKPRTGLGPRKLIEKTRQFEPIQLGNSYVVPV